MLMAVLNVSCGGGGDTTPTAPPAPSPQPPPEPSPQPPPEPSPRVCADEHEQAVAFGAILVEEWNGEPFRFYFDAAMPDSEVDSAKHVLATAERLSRHIKEQIGYSIFEVGDWVQGTLPLKTQREARGRYCNDGRSEGQAFAVVVEQHWEDDPEETGAVTASPRCTLITYWGNHVNVEKDSIIGHELFHLLGFTHSRKPLSNGRPHPSQSPPGEGVEMSVELTGGTAPPDLGVTYEDVDALRCIFPEGG